jgi:predicted Zn-dependent peptidase
MARVHSQHPVTLASIEPLVTTLPNGLRVVATRLPNVHRTAIVAHLRVGSRYESDADNGSSHLLEHMLYRGIPGYPNAHQQALAFEALGGTLVAGTGADSGSLAISCPTHNFEATLDLFSRVYTAPLLTGLATEKGIVREEILEDLDEEGVLVDDYDLLRALAFEGHPLGFPVIGTVSRIESLAVEQLRHHHERHYVGVGSVLSIVGPVDPEAATRVAERHFANVPRGAEIPFTPPAPQDAARFKFVQHGASQTALRVGFRGEGVRAPSEPAAELLLRLLDDGNSTRLYARLCDERGLAYDVSAGFEAADDVGLLDVGCEVAHENAVTVLGEIFDVVRSVRDAGPTETELDKAKARHRWSLEEMLDSPVELSEFLADATLRGYTRTPFERSEQLDAVQGSAVRDVAERLFRADRLSGVVVGAHSKRSLATLMKCLRDFA